MWQNYFKVAFRHLRKNRLYSIINIAGLTVGLTACLLIGLYIHREWSYDKFHEKGERIYRATMEYKSAGTVNQVALTGTRVGPQLTRLFPSIENYARTFIGTRICRNESFVFEESRVLFADSAFFTIFSFPFLSGNPHTALGSPDQIVLTRSAAIKYFGSENALGKTLQVNDIPFTVSGIIGDTPPNSQLKFDMALPFSNLGNQVKNEIWWTANYITYFLLQEKQDAGVLEGQIQNYMNTPAVRQEARLEGDSYLKFHLEPLQKVHLYSSLSGFEPNGSIRYLYLFGIIALLILIIACANYTNLATAQSASRTGEIAIRKVMGASVKRVFRQFLGESFLLVLLASILALAASALLLPYFNRITGKEFNSGEIFRPLPILATFLMAFLVSLAAGSYPAFVISGVSVMSVLRKGFNFTGSRLLLRKALIVLQFCISIFLIIYTLILMQQLSFLMKKDLGYNRDHLIILPVDQKMSAQYADLKTAISEIPGVQEITGAYETPEFIEWGDGIHATDEKGGKDLSVNALPVDLNFIKTMKMRLVAGRDFQENDFSVMDTSNNYANYRSVFILNESTVKDLGWSPEQAIGRTIEKGAPGIIVGVVKDFHFESMHEPIKPLVIFLDRGLVRNFMVRVSGNNIQATLGQLGDLWKKRVAHRPFEYHFLDEDFNKLYQSEQQVSTLFTWASGLAILLACLGLFGLSAYTTLQRTKEIGIRRVLGAGIGNIAWLIATHFLKLVALAIVLVVPVAWYAGNQWLQDFAYRIHISPWIFLFTTILALGLTLVTVGFQAIRAALANPVKSLRSD